MGWCSATRIFDAVVAATKNEADPEELIRDVASILEDGDWDCEQDSVYWDDPMVQKVFRQMHPDWFEDEDGESEAKP